MSDPLVFDPRGVESLKDFNNRIAQFCQSADTPVVNVVASLSRQCLVLSLAEPGDFPYPLYHAMQPIIFPLSEADHRQLEATLVRLCEEIRQWLGKDTPIHSIQTFDIAAEHRAATPDLVGYAFFIAVIGEVPDESDGDETESTGSELGE